MSSEWLPKGKFEISVGLGVYQRPVLQIRMDNRDNLGIFFYVSINTFVVTSHKNHLTYVHVP